MTAYRVRCPRCGGAAPEDERWCSGCGGVLTDELLVLEPPAPGPAATHRRSRQKRRLGRWTIPATGVLAAALVVGLLVSVSGDDDGAEVPRAAATPSVPTAPSTTTTTTGIPVAFLPEPTGGVKLVLAGDGKLNLVDLDASTVVTRDVPGLTGRPSGPQTPGIAVVRRGDRVVYQNGDVVSSLPLDLAGEPQVIGRADFFLPSARENGLWLFSFDDGAVVEEVDLQGRRLAAPVRLPGDWYPQAAVDAGIVLTRFDRFQVWDPTTGRVRFESRPGGALVAAGGDRVAWAFTCPPPFCPIHLTDVATGRDGTTGLYGQFGASSGSISSDGKMLAVTSYLVSDQSGPQPGVDLFDIESGTSQSFANAEANQTFSWSDSGWWLFALSPEGGPSARPMAYRLGGTVGRQVKLPAAAAGAFAMVAV